MKCPKCQREIPDDFKFCPECGSSVSSESRDSGIEGDLSQGDVRTLQSPGDAAQTLERAAGSAEAPPGGRSIEGEIPTQPPGPGGAGGRPDGSLGDIKTLEETGEAGAPGTGSAGTPLADRYELGEELGRGGFAVVWKARDKKLGRIVAVKRLLADKLKGKSGRQTLERFRREAQAIAQLNHRNIVSVHDHDRDAEGDYIVMEYVGGGTLRDWLKARQGGIDLPQALDLARGIAQGLAHAHRKNLVHRDIKPANILLHKDGDELTPKIVDFGLARAGSDSELSMTGYGMGTPYYMPPEQRRDAKSVNHTADIYALGKVLYELVSGEIPDNVDPEKIPALPGLSECIFKCIKSNPEERYFSADEVLQALEGLDGRAGRIPTARQGGENACPSCGAANEDGVKFCESCGTGLTRNCPECDRENSIHKQYCGGCGTDIDGFLKWKDALPRLEKHAEDKRWSRVIKEHDLLPQDARLPGDKGGMLRKQVDELHKRAAAELQKIETAKREVNQAESSRDPEQLEKALVAYGELCPHDAAVQERLEKLRARLDDAAWEQAREKAAAREAEEDHAGLMEIYGEYLRQYPRGRHAEEATKARQVAEQALALETTAEKALETYALGQFGECIAVCENLLKDGDFAIEVSGRQMKCSELLTLARNKAAALDKHLRELEDALRTQSWPAALSAAEAALALAPKNAVATGGRRRAMLNLRRRRRRRIVLAIAAVLLAGAALVTAAIEIQGAVRFRVRTRYFERLLQAGVFEEAWDAAQLVTQPSRAVLITRQHAPAQDFLNIWESREACLRLRQLGLDRGVRSEVRASWQEATLMLLPADTLLAAGEFGQARRKYEDITNRLAAILPLGSLRVVAEVPLSAREYFQGREKRIRIGSNPWKTVDSLPHTDEWLVCEQYEVRLEVAGFRVDVAPRRVTVRDGETSEARFTLTPEPARLTVSANAPGAEVFDDSGNKLGAAGIAFEVPSLASLALVVRASGHADGRVNVPGSSLPPGGVHRETVRLEERRKAEEETRRHARVPDGFRAESGDGFDPASNLPRVIVHERTGYRLRLIPAGEFLLGSPEGVGYSDERPQRRIHLDAYWIGETPVTCEQFARFLNERGNREEGGVTWVNMGSAIKIERAGDRFRAKSGLGDHPVVGISWYGARAVAQWMGGQLPTEAQWEKAAKGGREYRWPWGNTWDRNRANTAERIANVAEFRTYDEWLKWWEPYQRTVLRRLDGYADTTTPVRRYPANEYGLFDMAGNVWEWCEDWYVVNRYSLLRDGQRNPEPPASGDMQDVAYWQGGERKTDRQACRVVRGGGWGNRASFTRCAFRIRFRPAFRGTDIGVRVVVSPRP